MMKISIFLVFLLAFQPPARAQLLAQTCHTMTALELEASPRLQSYHEKFKLSTLQVCKLDDGSRADKYFACGPIKKSRNDLCELSMWTLDARLLRPPWEPVPMMLHKEGVCPTINDAFYARIEVENGNTEGIGDAFIAISTLLQQASQSSSAFDQVFSGVSRDGFYTEKIASSYFAAFRQQITSEKKIDIIDMQREQYLWGAYATFDISLRMRGKPAEFYSLRVRRLFGRLAVVRFGVGIY